MCCCCGIRETHKENGSPGQAPTAPIQETIHHSTIKQQRLSRAFLGTARVNLNTVLNALRVAYLMVSFIHHPYKCRQEGCSGRQEELTLYPFYLAAGWWYITNKHVYLSNFLFYRAAAPDHWSKHTQAGCLLF